MDTVPQGDLPLPLLEDPSLTRRRFLRGAALAGGGLIAAAGVAACAPAASQAGWTFGPEGLASAAPGAASPPPAASPDAGHSMAPSAAPSASSAPGGPIPTGWTQHDVDARDIVRRYLGNLTPALKGIYGDAAFAKLADILGAADAYPALTQKPSFVQVPQLFLNDALTPLKPELDGDVKVFNLTIDEMDWPTCRPMVMCIRASGFLTAKMIRRS